MQSFALYFPGRQQQLVQIPFPSLVPLSLALWELTRLTVPALAIYHAIGEISIECFQAKDKNHVATGLRFKEREQQRAKYVYRKLFFPKKSSRIELTTSGCS